MTTKDKLIEVTAQACAMIHEQFPNNNYVVSIFDDDGEKLSQTFRGRMSAQVLTALTSAAIDSLAKATETDRKKVIAAFLIGENPITYKEKM